MNISPIGIALIKSFEKCSLKAYQGAADKPGVITIGWGHVHGIVLGMECTQDEADALLHGDVLIAEDAVNAQVKAPITQNQFDALTSWTYNLGGGALKTSTLLKLINASRFTDAGWEFPKWNISNGKVVLGLTRRRQAEQTLFFKPE